ncbi:regulator of microtubule dynamics protein 1-like isoform X1 [Branchiostoma floridae x Branchiostoma japonicum]
MSKKEEKKTGLFACQKNMSAVEKTMGIAFLQQNQQTTVPLVYGYSNRKTHEMKSNCEKSSPDHLKMKLTVCVIFFDFLVLTAAFPALREEGLQGLLTELEITLKKATEKLKPEVLTDLKDQTKFNEMELQARGGGTDPVQQAIVQADELYSLGDTVELYQFLIQHKDSDDAGILWRLARATRDYAHLSTRKPEDKKSLTYQALQFAEQALHINPKDFACHKWYAICISDVGDYEGTKAKIAKAYVIRDHFKEAIALNPEDATSIHLLGLWCFTMADLPWYQRKIASVIFATPPTSTYDEALGYFLQAESVDPGFYSMNLLMLGKTYMRLGNTSAAMLWLEKVQTCPSKREEDTQAKLEAEQLLKTLGAAS